MAKQKTPEQLEVDRADKGRVAIIMRAEAAVVKFGYVDC